MKKKLLLFAALIVLAGFSSAFTVSLTTHREQEPEYTKMYKDMKTYDREWKKVDSLNRLSLPESARAIIDEIYEEARQQENVPQFLKAFVYRLNADAMKDEDVFVKSSKEIEAVIEKAAFPAKNILHSVAASMYWQYYQQNRWQFHNRTHTETSGSDIDTWDLHTIVDKTMEHYSASLARPELLQTISVTSFDPILYTDLDSKKYRPTLFDLLAFRTAEFYRDNEAGLTQPADFFSLSDEKYFAAAADFANYPVTTIDSLSFKYRALLLYRQIIAFHLHDADPIALIDADLQRLDFVYNHTTLEEKDSLYLAALQAMDRQWSAYPISTEILFRIARLYNQQGDAYHPFTNAAVQWKKKEALTVIETAVQRFRNSFGAQNCIRLKEGIERPGLTLTADKAVLPGKPILASLCYNNVSKVYYKIVAPDYKAMLKREWENEDNIDFYSTQKAVRQGEFVLPNGNDYQPHTVELALPELQEGYYVLLLSIDGQFTEDKIFSANEIWVTNLSYTTQYLNGECRIMALHRESGQPLAGVQIQTYTREYKHDYNYSEKERYVVNYGETYVTDAEGTIVLKGIDNNYRNTGFLLANGKDRYTTLETIYLYPRREQESNDYITTFFTDRAIYRPGQTVYFKGIVLQRNSADPHKTAIAPNYEEWITFYDVNGEEISDLEVITNEFGSFAGSFVIPATGLTGTMRIGGEHGSVYFQVEEYKRPKFETTFQPIKGHYRLNEKITVSGHAKAYAGSAVSDAKVSYRVAREARYPFWRWWWGPMPVSPAQEIINGETVTNADGSFDINFTAIPDRTIDKKQSPIFHYTVYATVSDINGETHEAQTMVAVGYQSLLLTTDAGEKINGNQRKSIEIKATSLNGEAQPTQGTLTIWKLRDPNRTLENRRWERPDKFVMSRAEFEQLFPFSVYDNEDDVSTWEKEKQVFNLSFDTGNATNYPLRDIAKWATGKYLLTVSAKDGFGEQVENTTIFTVFSEEQKNVPANDPVWFEVLNPTAQPGETVKILLGSAFQNVSLILETTDRESSQRQVIRLNNEQHIVEIPVLEKHHSNFNVGLFFVKNNRSYSASQLISVPYDNKKLAIELATFRDKLQPGQGEEWTITIKDKAGDAVAAELLASMYDASLDVFAPHQWQFFPWNNHAIWFSWDTGKAFDYRKKGAVNNNFSLAVRSYAVLNLPIDYRIYYSRGNELVVTAYGVGAKKMRSMAVMESVELMDNAMMIVEAPISAPEAARQQEEASADGGQPETSPTAQPPVQIRTNFNETAFFYPQLKTNKKGETVVSFTIPEALTRWKMQGLAWTKDLKVGSITKELVTQKDLMIITNAPRFFRENDTIYFSVKLSNMSDKDLRVKTTLHLSAPLAPQRGEITGELLIDKNSEQTTSLKAGENKPLSWKLIIPEGLQAITYRVVATSLPQGDGRGGMFSDGEESTIPVLTNRMLVTESLPLPIRGNETKQYEFKKLINNNSATLSNHSYTIEFTSNPAWNAVQALPYIMEYPYECAEQAFSRYYANAIATHIVNSDPKIKRVFEMWKNYQPTALQSNLEKNEELKMLLLEETPWVRDAQNDRERKQRIAALFDLNRMSHELSSALRKVEQAQTSGGGFAWFRGGHDNRYITQHIVAGIGHLQKMNIPTEASNNMLADAIRYMDMQITEDFAKLKKSAQLHKTHYERANNLGYMAIHYLYARSFFIARFPIPKSAQEAFDFYRTQAAKYWTENNNYLKGMLALALHRYNDGQTARLIMQSLSETALHSEEMGMYWRVQYGWWWYQAPIETQALMIEAYNEILNDQKSVDELKIWLLKQKQTQDWKTTKATAEAVYALLMTGSDLLASDKLCEITVGAETIDPYKLEGNSQPEAGTGYFKTSWKGEEVKQEMGNITVKNPNPTVAWGAAYWQYFEQLDKITPAETGVKIIKQLFVKENAGSGPVLKAINSNKPIKIGDKITVRIEIRADRDMEYVHLKDMRAAAFEPLNVLSGYRYQDGLWYYESTRDAATNFFIDYLPKGAYVFEYELFATQTGEFSNGITSLQCMYAPEFTTHSEGIRVKVEER